MPTARPAQEFVNIGPVDAAPTPGIYALPASLSSFTLATGVNTFFLNGNDEDFVRISQVTVTVVPEPSTVALALGGLATLTMLRRKRAK